MKPELSQTISILERLIAFPSLSGQPNLEMIGYIRDYLRPFGIEAELSTDERAERANLFATIGPIQDSGVVLSGHTDVVPVTGQNWSLPPFKLTKRQGRLYGRGSVDMKGFLACTLAMVPKFISASLKRPIHLAYSFDEETGSIGAPLLARQILKSAMRPAAVIVGEPTEMKIIAGHKGGYEMRTRFSGLAGHSSNPARGLSAIYYAARFISFLEQLGAEFKNAASGDIPFDPAYNTVNVGTIHGGAGRSIIAEDCTLEWELRITPPDDGVAAMARITAFLEETLLAEMRVSFPEAAIITQTESQYPGLAFDPASKALDIVRRMSGQNTFTTVPFGTDAGCFHRDGLSSIVFGPGSIEQAHKPDEYIEISQLEACLAFLDKLVLWQSRHQDL